MQPWGAPSRIPRPLLPPRTPPSLRSRGRRRKRPEKGVAGSAPRAGAPASWSGPPLPPRNRPVPRPPPTPRARRESVRIGGGQAGQASQTQPLVLLANPGAGPSPAARPRLGDLGGQTTGRSSGKRAVRRIPPWGRSERPRSEPTAEHESLERGSSGCRGRRSRRSPGSRSGATCSTPPPSMALSQQGDLLRAPNAQRRGLRDRERSPEIGRQPAPGKGCLSPSRAELAEPMHTRPEELALRLGLISFRSAPVGPSSRAPSYCGTPRRS